MGESKDLVEIAEKAFVKTLLLLSQAQVERLLEMSPRKRKGWADRLLRACENNHVLAAMILRELLGEGGSNG